MVSAVALPEMLLTMALAVPAVKATKPETVAVAVNSAAQTRDRRYLPAGGVESLIGRLPLVTKRYVAPPNSV
jgi:hypothetical protein